MNVNMLSQTTKAMNGKGFRSVVQRPVGASRASRVTLRTRQRRARAVVVFSSDSEGKETVAAVETKEPVEDIKIKSESEEVEATTAPETNEAETNGAVQVTKAVKSEEKKKKNTYNDPLLSVFKVDAPGVATKKRDPNYERKKMGVEPDAWNIVFKELTDAGLKSVSAKEASDLVGGSNAVMVDARTGDMHLLLSAGLSGASRWQWNWRQARGA